MLALLDGIERGIHRVSFASLVSLSSVCVLGTLVMMPSVCAEVVARGAYCEATQLNTLELAAIVGGTAAAAFLALGLALLAIRAPDADQHQVISVLVVIASALTALFVAPILIIGFFWHLP